MNNLKGKTIKEVKKLENGNVLITFQDGSFVLVEDFTITFSSTDLPNFELKESEKEEELEEEEESEEEEEEEEPKKESKEDDSEEDFWTMEDLKEMDKEELQELIDDEELDLEVGDYPTTRKLRDAIAKELGI